MCVVVPTSGKPGITKDIVATFAGRDHVGHLRFLFSQRVDLCAIVLTVPVGELCYPERLVIFFQTIELAQESLVIPVEGDVINMTIVIIFVLRVVFLF